MTFQEAVGPYKHIRVLITDFNTNDPDQDGAYKQHLNIGEIGLYGFVSKVKVDCDAEITGNLTVGGKVNGDLEVETSLTVGDNRQITQTGSDDTYGDYIETVYGVAGYTTTLRSYYSNSSYRFFTISSYGASTEPEIAPFSMNNNSIFITEQTSGQPALNVSGDLTVGGSANIDGYLDFGTVGEGIIFAHDDGGAGSKPFIIARVGASTTSADTLNAAAYIEMTQNTVDIGSMTSINLLHSSNYGGNPGTIGLTVSGSGTDISGDLTVGGAATFNIGSTGNLVIQDETDAASFCVNFDSANRQLSFGTDATTFIKEAGDMTVGNDLTVEGTANMDLIKSNDADYCIELDGKVEIYRSGQSAILTYQENSSRAFLFSSYEGNPSNSNRGLTINSGKGESGTTTQEANAPLYLQFRQTNSSGAQQTSTGADVSGVHIGGSLTVNKWFDTNGSDGVSAFVIDTPYDFEVDGTGYMEFKFDGRMILLSQQQQQQQQPR